MRPEEIKARVGDWFDVDWKLKAAGMSAGEWVEAYNTAWKEKPDTWVSPQDLETIGCWLPPGRLRVLEVGCGAGGTAIFLRERGHEVTAVDVSDVALRLLADRAERSGLRLHQLQAFMEALPFADDAFDAVVCCHTLEHARDLAKAVAELERVCAGRLIVIVPRQAPERYTEDYHTCFFGDARELGRHFHLHSMAGQEAGSGAAIVYVGEKCASERGSRLGDGDIGHAGGWGSEGSARQYADLLAAARRSTRAGRYEEALRQAMQAATLAWSKREGLLEDERLEQLLADIASASMPAAPHPALVSPPGAKLRVGYVISYGLNTGGHLQTLLNLLEHHSGQCEARLYSTETQDSRQVGPRFLEAIERLGVPLWLGARGAPLVDRARQLRERLCADEREVVVCFGNPDDAVAGVALRFLPTAVTAFFHHAANSFNINANCGDYHIDYLEGLRDHCQAHRPTANRVFLPLPGPDRARVAAERAVPRRDLNLPEGAVVTFTSAPCFKLFQGDGAPYFEMLAELMRREPRLHHIMIGYAAENYLPRVQESFASHTDILPRIRFLERQRTLIPLLKTADLVLDSFPLGGGNTSLEAMACGRPVVTLRDKGPLPMGPHEMVGLPECVARSPADYLEKALSLARDPVLRERTGTALARRFAERFAPEVVARRFEACYAAWVEKRASAWRRGPAPRTPVLDRYRVSVVVPVSNQVEHTRQSLEALVENTPDECGYEVIVVDNGSVDGTAEFLRSLEGDVRIIANERDRGLTHARNQGARAARGELLLFLNQNMVPQAGWLEVLLHALGDDPAVGAAGGKILSADGRIWSAGLVINDWVYGSHLCWDHLHRGLPAGLAGASHSRELQGVAGACLITRRVAFEAVGGFCEACSDGYADLDFCLKIRAAGYRVLYCPSCVVVRQAAVGEDDGAGDATGTLRFRHEWAGRVAADEVRAYLEDGLIVARMPHGLDYLPWAGPA